VAIRYDEALRMADKAALFKTAMKQVCFERNLSCTFMPKWNADLPGSSGHLHQSLWKDGANVFYEPADPNSLSAAARSYLGGQVALMPELTALYSPTVNAYKRYVPGVWAPLTASWGIENRTCAIRTIAGGSKGTRLEYRQTAADINPYVAIATCLAAGLYGMEKEIAPPPPANAAPANPPRRERRARAEQSGARNPGRGIRGSLRPDPRLGDAAIRARGDGLGAAALFRGDLTEAAVATPAPGPVIRGARSPLPPARRAPTPTSCGAALSRTRARAPPSRS